jgi:hypothetical protein
MVTTNRTDPTGERDEWFSEVDGVKIRAGINHGIFLKDWLLNVWGDNSFQEHGGDFYWDDGQRLLTGDNWVLSHGGCTANCNTAQNGWFSSSGMDSAGAARIDLYKPKPGKYVVKLKYAFLLETTPGPIGHGTSGTATLSLPRMADNTMHVDSSSPNKKMDSTASLTVCAKGTETFLNVLLYVPVIAHQLHANGLTSSSVEIKVISIQGPN